MNKVAHYLQEHMAGEVITSTEARAYFSTDGSVLTVTPSIIVYPRNENDIRKVTRFSWQLAERGRVMPITARGLGTDQSGAALGSGIIMVFPAHMNRIIELDGKVGTVVVEPGINYGKLQQTLHTHGRFLPPYPASLEFSTVGGAVGNNAGGERSIKYGSTRDFVKTLRVVLANGEVITTGRLSKRELNKKLGLSTFEGEVYRSLDKLIEENHEHLVMMNLPITKNSAGYALDKVKRKDGSFDLTPLFVGSQGTLGVVSEITLKTELYNPSSTLIGIFFDDLQLAEEVMIELRKFAERPSAMEAVDVNLLNFIHETNPNLLKGIVKQPFPKLILLVEFDNSSDRIQKKMTKKVEKLLKKNQITYQIETEEQQQETLWKIRHSAALLVNQANNGAKPLPIIEDGIVPIDKFKQYLDKVYELFSKYSLDTAVWGHAGDGNLHFQPFLNLSQIGDRQKMFKLLDEYYSLVIDLGGSTTGEHGDGRLRGPYLKKLYGNERYEMFRKLKEIFDPYGTLNPGVKVNVSIDDIKPLLRQSYALDHLLNHLPTS
ncbi:MAG TPA: FAD-binding oxidoreductase [Candidatus Saccharimonadales bacterium]|nr:FAD-binding oxidoreductase [Candidatus Saccharimonadales bacterium]